MTTRSLTPRLTTGLVRTGGAVVLAAAVLAVPAPAQAAPPPGPLLVCQQGVCLLNASGVDSDGDGWSDADEQAAGTDPNDSTSHPQILQILDGFLDHGIRPEGFALREVIVLPSTAPDGSSLTSDLFAFGPQRAGALGRLGLTHPLLSGLSSDNGVRAVIDTAGTGSTGGPPVMVGGMDISLISSIFRVHEEPRKPVTTHHADGSVSTFAPGKGSDFGFAVVAADTTGPNGETITSHSSLSQVSGPHGAVFSIETTRHVTATDGTSVTTTHTAHTYKDSSGKVTETTASVFTTQVNPDGSKVDTFALTVTNRTGETTTTVTTTTTNTDGEVTGSTTTCTGVNCPTRESGEIDSTPVFVAGSTITATPELTRRLEVLAGRYTNQGDTPVEIGPDDEPEPPQYSPLNPGVIYVDPSNDAVWWSPQPSVPDPDEVGGNVTVVRGHVPPELHCLPTQQLPCPS